MLLLLKTPVLKKGRIAADEEGEVIEKGQSADDGENAEDAEKNGNNGQDLEDEPVPANVAQIQAGFKCSLCHVDFGLGT